MPDYAFKIDANNTQKTISAIQKFIRSDKFDGITDEQKRTMYAFIFAGRAVVNSVRGDKHSLQVPLPVEAWSSAEQQLAASETFKAFVESKTHADMKALLRQGHGGAAEDEYKKFVLNREKLPGDVPDRWMPSARERIEQQQKKLNTLEPDSPEATAVYAEMFRCRRSVGAVRGSASSLEPKINGEVYAAQPDLSESASFKQFVKDKGAALKQAALSGHAGAAEELYKDHVLHLDHLPADVPQSYLPQALERTEAIQERFRSTSNPQRQNVLFAEMMATRETVGAVEGEKNSLKRDIDAAALQESYDKWANCATFQDYLKRNENEARNALLSGHGGALGAKFRNHVSEMDHIPEDVPASSMPTAVEHIEALQKKYKEVDYYERSPEQKVALAAELMASREAVQAVRGNKDSLNKQINAETLQSSYRKWNSCAAFKDFVLNENQKVHDGATAGHGGALGDKFKEFVVDRDRLEPDIPAEYMPTARVRTEALQKKIRQNADPEKNAALYAELIATRSAVGAVRGKKDSLDLTVTPEALDRDRKQLMECEAFKNFVSDPERADKLKTAALEGHGGALEDEFKDYVKQTAVLPDQVPYRYLPTGLERTEALQEKIRKNEFDDPEARADAFVELVATREAVAAVRGNKDSLNKPVDPQVLAASREKWNKCESFRDYVSGEGLNAEDARKAALSGHGGTLLEKFKEDVKGRDRLPEDLPGEVVPNADERIEAIQKKLRSGGVAAEDKGALYAQILAARGNVNAERGKKESLEKPLDPKAVNEHAEKLTQSKTFGDFLKLNGDLAERSAVSGHGGEMEDQFKHYVKSQLRLPTDVPKDYMPTAKERIEGLQGRFESREFKNADLQTKMRYYAELMGARRAVNAERNKAGTLEYKVDPEKAAKYADELMECDEFRRFIEEDPLAAKKAASAGHGGALEDKFKEFVLNRDSISYGVPAEYMPNAKKRTEVLQDKIKELGNTEKDRNEAYKLTHELLATRVAANSIRGDKSSLDKQMDKAAWEKTKMGFANSRSYSSFATEDTDLKELKKAATTGHGGALEDKFKDYCLKKSAETCTLPDRVPDRFMPTVGQLRLQVFKDIVKDKEKTRQFNRIDVNDESIKSYKKKTATVMYLSKLEVDAKKNNEPNPRLKPELMEKNVNKLANSGAFGNMFGTNESARETLNMIADKHISDLFTKFQESGGKFKLEKEQKQPERQLEQNQPELAQDQPEGQPEQQLQQRRRAVSVNEPQRKQPLTL